MTGTDLIELLAQMIHEEYLVEQRSRGVRMGETAAMRGWSDLDEDLKTANRAQAAAIGDKLAGLGYVVREAGEANVAADPNALYLADDDIERLARIEHERWSAQRLAAGWRYGPVRDNAAKLHPCLIGWDDLSEAERDKDRDVLRRLPSLLAKAGLDVRRAPLSTSYQEADRHD